MLLTRVGRHAKRALSSYVTALDHAAASQSACGCRGALPAAQPVCGGATQAARAVESPAQPTLQPQWSYQQPQTLSMLSRGFAKGAAKAKRGAGRSSHCNDDNMIFWQQQPMPDSTPHAARRRVFIRLHAHV